jgi:hypothetical protein
MHADTSSQPQPVVARLEDFDTRSGNALERAFFNHRPWVVAICLVLTLVLGWFGTKLALNASFEKTIPTSHPYIVNYLAHQGDLAGQGNALRLVVQARQGTIYDKDYLDTLQKINDAIFLLPGVDRPFMKSLWTSSTRWVAVTEEGLDGGPVIPDTYDGSPASLAELRANVERSGEIGQLVAGDFASSIIFVPLLDRTADGKPLDYGDLSRQIEVLRAQYSNDKIAIGVTGFAKVVGDLIAGLQQVLLFFLLALAITTVVLYGYTRCARSTALVVACSLVAVVWQFGLLYLLGYELDPYSVLVPFLVFAIGMSHGAQKMNGIMQDMGRGTHRVVAARYTFRRLFMAGLTALLCDAVGFAVLVIIQIKVIQDLALIASIGVAVLIFTNLVLLPILLSYTGVAPSAAARSLRDELVLDGAQRPWLWALLDHFTQKRWAVAAIAVSALMAAEGVHALVVDGLVVDVDHAGLELLGHGHGPPHRLGNHRRRQAAGVVVGQGNRFFVAAVGDDVGHRAKGFFLEHAHAGLDAAEHRGLVEQAVKAAAGFQLGAAAHAVLHQGMYAVTLLGIDQRAQGHLAAGAIAHGQMRGLGNQALGEFRRHAFMHQDAVRRHADLALMEVRTPGRVAGRHVQVGVVQDQQRVGAAQLQRHLLQMAAGQLADAAPHGHRAGEGDHGHARVHHQGLARFCVTG